MVKWFLQVSDNLIKGNVVKGHWPDNGNVNVNSSNANFLNVGGNYNDGDNAGLFYGNINVNSTNSNSSSGSRNSYKAPTQIRVSGKSTWPCHLAKHDWFSPCVGTLDNSSEGRCSFTMKGEYLTIFNVIS